MPVGDPRRDGRGFGGRRLDKAVDVDVIVGGAVHLHEVHRSQDQRRQRTRGRANRSAADEEDVKFLTGKDKFAALARKNPNLHTLKNRFNLDIDY